MLNFLVKTPPGTVEQQEVEGVPTGGYLYPNANDVHFSQEYSDGTDWEVWLMNANDSEEAPFTPKVGDTILAGWDWDTGEVVSWHPIHADLQDYIEPIGNELNEVTSTFDGTVSFPTYLHFLGHATRFWGTTNQYPDNNQARRIYVERFETDWAGQLYQRVRFILGKPFDKDNTPNALAILIYTDPERQNYYYTPGAFILDTTDPDNTFWYAETTIGQSPVAVPEDVHYCVALGSAPLNGGGTIPRDFGKRIEDETPPPVGNSLGNYNAEFDSPPLPDPATLQEDDYYVVSVAGTVIPTWPTISGTTLVENDVLRVTGGQYDREDYPAEVLVTYWDLEHHSFNWEENLKLESELAFITRMGWQGYTVASIGTIFLINYLGWPFPLIRNDGPSLNGVEGAKPFWMPQNDWDGFVIAIHKAAGLESTNANP